MFRAPCGGVPTKGSSYPRCELRKMQPAGSQHASWDTDDGTIHTLSLDLAITKTPPIKSHVICAQIHDASADVITVRLEGAKLLIERTGASDVILDRNYQLGARFALKIQAASGHTKVWRDNTLHLDWPLSRPGCYFKAGCYTQSNPQTGDSPDSYGEVVIYRLHVQHGPQP